MFAALRYRDFRWLWTSTFCSTAGQWIQATTIGWVVYDLTGSGAMLGAVFGVRAIPMFLLVPLVGIIADRFDRRRTLMATQSLMMVACFWLAAALALHVVQVWHLFVFMSFAGANTTFDRTLRATLVFDVVPREATPNAVAVNNIALSATRSLGPGIAGLLIAWIGPAWNFALQGLLYAGMALAVYMLRTPYRTERSTQRESVWNDMKAGLRFAATDPVARMMMLLGLVPPMLLIPAFGALMPVFAVKVFTTGPDGLGLLLSAVGVGGVLGGVIATSVSKYERVGLLQILTLLAFAVALTGFALSPGMAVAAGFLIAAGAAEMVLASSTVSTMQLCAPHEMRGRVSSLLQVFPAFISVGALTSGIGADLLGPQLLVMMMCALAACIAAAAWSGSAVMRGLSLSKLMDRQH